MVSQIAQKKVKYSRGLGFLYNWYAGDTNLLAPTGWHVPTYAEFATLIASLTSASVAGGKMKETGNTNWLTEAPGTTNSSGLTVKGAGYRTTSFFMRRSYTRLLIITAFNASYNYFAPLSYTTLSCIVDYNSKYCGYSVRCLKDDSTPTDTVTDIDGNIYNTVTVGTQIWMQTNLKTKRYNDGTYIPYIADPTTWTGLTTGAYCIFNNDLTNV